MKGIIEGNTQLLVELLVGIVAIVFAAMMIVQNVSKSEGFQSWVCTYLPICQQNKETLYDQIANESTEALWCAINSVSLGAEDKSGFCSKYLESTAPPMGTRDNEGKIIKATQATFSCKTGNDGFECAVTAFELQQKITTATKLSAGLGGDPRYLVYYEQFPEGEDQSWNTWAAVNVILTIVPAKWVLKPLQMVGKFVLSPIIGGAKLVKFVSKGGSKLFKFLGEKIGKEGAAIIEKISEKSASDARNVILEIAKTGIQHEVPELAAKEFAKKFGLAEAEKYVIEGSVKAADGSLVVFVKEGLEDAAVKEVETQTVTGGAFKKIKFYSLSYLTRLSEAKGFGHFSNFFARSWVEAAQEAGYITKEAAEYLATKNILKNKALITVLKEEEEKAISSELKKIVESSATQIDADNVVEFFKGQLTNEMKVAKVSPITLEELEAMQRMISPQFRDKVFMFAPKYILIDQSLSGTEETIDEAFGQKYLDVNTGQRSLIFKEQNKKEGSKMKFNNPSKYLGYVKLRKSSAFQADTRFYLASPCMSDLRVWKGDDKGTCRSGSAPCILVEAKDLKKYEDQVDSNFCYSVGGPLGTGFLGLAPWPCHGVFLLDSIPGISDLLEFVHVSQKC